MVWQLLAEMCLVFVNAGLVGEHSGHNRCAAWIAQRPLAIGAVESDAASRQAIQVRRLHQLVPVGSELIAKVVRENEQHVRFFAGWLGRSGKACRARAYNQSPKNQCGKRTQYPNDW